MLVQEYRKLFDLSRQDLATLMNLSVRSIVGIDAKQLDELKCKQVRILSESCGLTINQLIEFTMEQAREMLKGLCEFKDYTQLELALELKDYFNDKSMYESIYLVGDFANDTILHDSNVELVVKTNHLSPTEFQLIKVMQQLERHLKRQVIIHTNDVDSKRKIQII